MRQQISTSGGFFILAIEEEQKMNLLLREFHSDKVATSCKSQERGGVRRSLFISLPHSSTFYQDGKLHGLVIRWCMMLPKIYCLSLCHMSFETTDEIKAFVSIANNILHSFGGFQNSQKYMKYASLKKKSSQFR